MDVPALDECQREVRWNHEGGLTCGSRSIWRAAEATIAWRCSFGPRQLDRARKDSGFEPGQDRRTWSRLPTLMKDSSEWSRSGWPSEYHCPSKRLSWRAVSPMAFGGTRQGGPNGERTAIT